LSEGEIAVLMYSKYFLLSPLQKREGARAYTQRSKQHANTLRDE